MTSKSSFRRRSRASIASSILETLMLRHLFSVLLPRARLFPPVLRCRLRLCPRHATPHARPKRQRTGALQDASRISDAVVPRASVLDCGGPPPLFPDNMSSIANCLFLPTKLLAEAVGSQKGAVLMIFGVFQGVCQLGRMILPDRRTTLPTGGITLPDRRVALPFGRMVLPSRRVALPTGRWFYQAAE